jgi:hypothetical protein
VVVGGGCVCTRRANEGGRGEQFEQRVGGEGDEGGEILILSWRITGLKASSDWCTWGRM